jgi:acyl-coenzyme A thioesterase PaaI-like protein
MLVSEGVLKWAINLYPPLFFQRIRVIKFDKGFTGASIKVSKSILNTNYHDSIFGGTIFSAADPFYPVLFYQVLIRKGYKVKAWSRSSAIRFVKPGKTNLYFRVQISETDISGCEEQLNTTGKYRKSFQVEIYDKNDKLCASLINEIYVRNLNFIDDKANDLGIED